jgi:hypothetical protein
VTANSGVAAVSVVSWRSGAVIRGGMVPPD